MKIDKLTDYITFAIVNIPEELSQYQYNLLEKLIEEIIKPTVSCNIIHRDNIKLLDIKYTLSLNTIFKAIDDSSILKITLEYIHLVFDSLTRLAIRYEIYETAENIKRLTTYEI